MYYINVNTQEIAYKEVDTKYRFIGGRGLIANLMIDEVDPLCDPLGKKNKLIIAPGLMAGTTAPCSGRLSIGSKSPLTGGIRESNSGGTAAYEMGKLGIKAIIIEDIPKENDDWYSIYISNDKVEFIKANEIIGKGNYETTEYYRKIFGDKISIISIGPAGEKRFPNSTIAVTNMEGIPSRQAARGGLGSVLGSKKIKAIIIENKNKAKKSGEIYDPITFKNLNVKWSRELIKNKKQLHEFGTTPLVQNINKVGGLPIQNFRYGSSQLAENLYPDKFAELIDERGGKRGHSCHPGCVIRCSNIFNDKDGNYLTSGLEYETIGLTGPNLGIFNYDTIAKIDRFCDDFGLDTIELGVAIAIYMESGYAQFGNEEQLFGLIDEIKNDTVIGRLIANGAGVVAKVLGVKRAPIVKNMAMASYDPRALKGTGVTYATSPQGADHTAGSANVGKKGYREGTNGLDTHKEYNQVRLSQDLQVMMAVLDTLGLCIFVGGNIDTMNKLAPILTSLKGEMYKIEDVLKIGINTIMKEIEFNKKAGITNQDNRLPEFFYNEPLKPFNLTFDVSEDELNEIFIFNEDK